MPVREDKGAYSKWSAGSPDIRFYMNLDWSKTEQDGCWIWAGACRGAYPNMTVGDRTISAHKWVYQKHRGPIPKGFHIDHLCRNKHCVNPNHLEAVPLQVNVLRAMAWSVVDKWGIAAARRELEQLASKIAAEV